MELIQKAYGDEALSRTTIFDLHRRFREGRDSMMDDESSGRPTTSRTNDNIAAVDKMVKEDRKVTSRLIADNTRHPKHCGSTDFKRGFEEMKIVLKIRQQ